ncbi:MAG: hypothetical protein RKO25_10900 [Candidatus Contendobacter sp.]|nr:hypothetical protein [Candidatus Contendobacter sp.]
MTSDPRRAQVGNCHAAPESDSESDIPDWAHTIHPREIAFYEYHIDTLDKINQAISAIAGVLADAQVHEETCGELDWLNGRVRHGLHRAIDMLTDQAAGSIEFMQQRAAKYRPAQN